MNFRIVSWSLLTLGLAAAQGCGPSLAPPMDSEKARDALSVGLEAWKKSEARDTLQQRLPPVYFRDPDWAAGWKLLDFRTTLDDEPLGRQRRCHVRLSLKSPKGLAAGKEVQYRVDASSTAVVIIRDED